MNSLENKELRGVTLKGLIALIAGIVSIVSSILYGVFEIKSEMQMIRSDFRGSTDSIKRTQEIRSIVTDKNFEAIRQDIQDIKERVK